MLRGRGHGDPWARIVAATEADVALVVIDGVARYGDTKLMSAAAAPARSRLTSRAKARRVALPDPADTTTAWSWTAIMRRRSHDVQHDPQAALIDRARTRRRRAGFAADAGSSCFSTCPTVDGSAAPGHPNIPQNVKIPPVPTLEHDHAYFTCSPVPRSPVGRSTALARRFGRDQHLHRRQPSTHVVGEPLTDVVPRHDLNDLEARRTHRHSNATT